MPRCNIHVDRVNIDHTMAVGGVGLTAVDADTLTALKPLTGVKSCAFITRYYRLKERIAGEM